MKPIVREHEGVLVVRDDLFPGGTKARFLHRAFDGTSELVYASPAQGGAQSAIAHVAARLGKRATIFVAKRQQPHARALEAKRVGAKVMQVAPGYLAVVKARAREYCERTGARLLPFGANMPWAIEAIAEAARSTGIVPDEVWCAAGSGVLTRGLRSAWPSASVHAVQVGRELSAKDVDSAKIHRFPKPFDFALAASCTPFPSDPHYDAKAWRICSTHRSSGRIVLFWNVTGPANPHVQLRQA